MCAGHREKTCYTGSDDGYGCPWLVFPGKLTTNTYCGLCTECLKTCTMNNVAIYLREPGKDLVTPQKRGVDEAFKGLIMLACAFIYSAVLLGPWGVLKDAARAPFTLPWVGYAAAFLGLNLVIVPGLFFLAVAAGEWLTRQGSPRNHDQRPEKKLCRIRRHPGPAGPGRLDRFLAVVRADQLLVCLARSVRPIRMGLEPVRDGRIGMDAVPAGACTLPADPRHADRPGRRDRRGAADRPPAWSHVDRRPAGRRILLGGHRRPARSVPGVICHET